MEERTEIVVLNKIILTNRELNLCATLYVDTNNIIKIIKLNFEDVARLTFYPYEDVSFDLKIKDKWYYFDLVIYREKEVILYCSENYNEKTKKGDFTQVFKLTL